MPPVVRCRFFVYGLLYRLKRAINIFCFVFILYPNILYFVDGMLVGFICIVSGSLSSALIVFILLLVCSVQRVIHSGNGLIIWHDGISLFEQQNNEAIASMLQL